MRYSSIATYKNGRYQFKSWFKLHGFRREDGQLIADISINKRHPGFWLVVWVSAWERFGLWMLHPVIFYRFIRIIVKEFRNEQAVSEPGSAT